MESKRAMIPSGASQNTLEADIVPKQFSVLPTGSRRIDDLGIEESGEIASEDQGNALVGFLLDLGENSVEGA